MDTVKAFIQFLVDLFSALTNFLVGQGSGLDLGDLIGSLTGGETTAPASGD